MGDGSQRVDRPVDRLAELLRSGRVNAAVAWVLVLVLAAVFVESALGFDRLWTAFAAATAVVVLLPPAAGRDWRVMLPWELLVVALAPILLRAVVGGELGTFAYYVSVAALSLLVTVELHMFTELKMTDWFAVVFVVLTTLASAAVWAAVRWNMDRLLGTDMLGHLAEQGAPYLAEPTAQEAANAGLMVEWVWVTLAGLAAGLLFDAYFRRRGRRLAARLRGVVRR